MNKLIEGKSYFLQNLRLRIVKNKMFLNTTKTEEFKFEEIQRLTNLTPPTLVAHITEMSMIAKIIGVHAISTYVACGICGKKGEV